MTERLYYHDSYLREFAAVVVETANNGTVAYLDRTAFYPTSGGQPFDTGSLAGVRVEEVTDEGDRIAHRLSKPLAADHVVGAIDWDRRFDHMQQHTGQHLLSAVFEERFHLRTVSFHLGQEASTIDLEGGPVDPRIVQETESRANAIVFENRSVTVRYEDAAEVQGLRKASDREGTLRIVAIEGLDNSACGGTHVRVTGEIGPILIHKLEKIRQSVRVEFLCGARAVRRARADYDALTKISQLVSAPADETPGLVAAQLENARAAAKAQRKLEADLAAYQGRELYQATAPGADGIRRIRRRLTTGSLDDLAALAQSFTAQPRAVFIGALDDPPSLLYAVSEDAGIDAAAVLKSALGSVGGRGGGTARMARGSVPNRDALDQLWETLG